MKKSFFILLLWFVFLGSANAATVYVDKDNACPGSGSARNPYCSIQNAFNHSALAPGDHIKIRDAASAYDESSTTKTDGSVDGTPSNPIVIEPDAGANPNLVAPINLANVNYWEIRNLRFDASGVLTTSKHAIHVQATSRPLIGITIRGNTFNYWGGTNQGALIYNSASIRIDGVTSSSYYVTPTISNNTITNGKQTGIGIAHTRNALVIGNVISGLRCGLNSANYYRSQDGIFAGNDGINPTIRGNTISSPQSGRECFSAVRTTNNTLVGGGIYCDVGQEGGLVENNDISGYNGDGTPALIAGIFWESRCHRATIHRNIIHDMQGNSGTGAVGIRVSAGTCANNTGNKIIHNTIVNVKPWGIEINAASSTVENNIVTIQKAGSAAILVDQDGVACGGHTINGNLYYDNGSNTKIGKWGIRSVANFVTWKRNCSCDGNSPTPADPQFVSPSNLTLTSSSPALNGGVNIGKAYDGTAPENGAYEVPTLPSRVYDRQRQKQ